MSTTMTSSITMPGESSSILLPAAGGDFDIDTRIVRFDSECVLIPDCSKRPKPLSKSYSLPLWKRRPTFISDSGADLPLASSEVSPSTEETHVVLKVPIPRFISPIKSKGSTPASPPTPKPLSPCLVHRTPTTSLPSPTLSRPVRRSSPPISSPTKRRDDALTIPLRACCDDCVIVTEKSFKEGEQWQEKFTRGARRRRSASLDNVSAGLNGNSLTSQTGPRNAFAAVAVDSLSPRHKPTVAITVDEVDKRRKSQEYFEGVNLPSCETPVPHSVHASYSPTSYPKHQRASLAPPETLGPDLSPHNARPRSLKASPIQEEDEDQLFPLPSPRRTPNTSPSISPLPSARNSPIPSPNASASCLSLVAGILASKESLVFSTNTQDGTLDHSFSRKKLLLDDGTLKLDSYPSSSLSPISSESIPSMPLIESPVTETSSKPKLPLLSTQLHTVSPITESSASNPFPPIQSTEGGAILSPSSAKSWPLSIPLTAAQSSTSQSVLSASPPSISTSIISRSPPNSPASPTKKPHRPSFSLPYLKGAIKGAGADMLKGVNSISGSGMAGHI